jgi:type IV secretion system protein TrbL
MNGAPNIGFIDLFTDTFSKYIDSGFGLLKGEVGYLASTLIVIDMTIAGLFWALAPDEDVLARLVKKTLYIGFFAFLIQNFSSLSNIIYSSFAGLGLKAAGSAVSLSQFAQPGTVAQTGLNAAFPLFDAAAHLSMWQFPLMFVLLAAYIIVILSFFVMAVQLFVTLIEFKLTSLAGFILVPFGLFNKTAFLAERVLGNVVASGVKVLVLAIVFGIGNTLFSTFTGMFTGSPLPTPTIDQAEAVALAALTLLGISIFAPGVATGLVSGAPQLGAGAAVGVVQGVGGLATSPIRGAVAMQSISAQPAAISPGGGPTSGGPSSAGGSPTPGAGGAGATASAGGLSGAAASSGSAPAWARRMAHRAAAQRGISAAVNMLRSSDRGGPGYSVDLSERD